MRVVGGDPVEHPPFREQRIPERLGGRGAASSPGVVDRVSVHDLQMADRPSGDQCLDGHEPTQVGVVELRDTVLAANGACVGVDDIAYRGSRHRRHGVGDRKAVQMHRSPLVRCGDLLTGDHQKLARCSEAGVQLRHGCHLVVIGDDDEVKAEPLVPLGNDFRRRVAVASIGVDVRIAAVPSMRRFLGALRSEKDESRDQNVHEDGSGRIADRCSAWKTADSFILERRPVAFVTAEHSFELPSQLEE